jgi:hypothetical protein
MIKKKKHFKGKTALKLKYFIWVIWMNNLISMKVFRKIKNYLIVIKIVTCKLLLHRLIKIFKQTQTKIIKMYYYQKSL